MKKLRLFIIVVFYSSTVFSQDYISPLKLPNLETVDSAIIKSLECFYEPMKYVYSFDSQNRMTQVVKKQKYGSIWVDEVRVTYKYNLDGQKTSKIIEGIWQNKWSNSKRQSYDYDTFGNMYSTYLYDWDGLRWLCNRRIIYKYNSKNQLISKQIEEKRQPNWIPTILINSTYNLDGFKTNDVISSWVESELKWEEFRRDTFGYSPGGDLTMHLIEGYLEHKYSYDNDGDIIKWSSKLYENNDWIEEGQFTFGLISNEFVQIKHFGYSKDATVKLYDSHGNTFNFSCCYDIKLFGKIITSINTDNSSNINYNLSQNYPNPFNPITKIKYQISKAGHVTLKVYNILGIEVAILVNEKKNVGNFATLFNASNLTSGVYFYTIQVNDFVKTNKMLLIK